MARPGAVNFQSITAGRTVVRAGKVSGGTRGDLLGRDRLLGSIHIPTCAIHDETMTLHDSDDIFCRTLGLDFRES